MRHPLGKNSTTSREQVPTSQNGLHWKLLVRNLSELPCTSCASNQCARQVLCGHATQHSTAFVFHVAVRTYLENRSQEEAAPRRSVSEVLSSVYIYERRRTQFQCSGQRDVASLFFSDSSQLSSVQSQIHELPDVRDPLQDRQHPARVPVRPRFLLAAVTVACLLYATKVRWATSGCSFHCWAVSQRCLPQVFHRCEPQDVTCEEQRAHTDNRSKNNPPSRNTLLLSCVTSGFIITPNCHLVTTCLDHQRHIQQRQ